MFATWRCLSAFLILGLLSSSALSQERQPNDPNAPAPPPPGIDKYYWDLSQSKEQKDRAVKSLAERYITLVKVQEWNDLNGKFRTVARYVKHTPDLATVTIETVKGRGAERQTKEVTVPVDKLSKNCQSRVKQIDTLQKKIKEMSPPKLGENGAVPGTGEVPGSPIAGILGPEGAAPMPQTPAAPEPDPSAAESDPLGFAEVPLAPPGPPGGAPPEGVPRN
jgi:hypothetical protein